jgi:hypothetical protein
LPSYGEGVDAPRYPIGKLFELGADTPFQHPQVLARESTTGPDRLRIGGGEDSVKLLVALAQVLAEPLYVLAVFRVTEPAKYESEPMTHADAASFFDEFGKLFSEDGRAQAWVGSMHDDGLIVLDEHDLLYASGPLNEFERILRDRGFTTGHAKIPAPHAHQYSPAFDTEEARLREWSGWGFAARLARWRFKPWNNAGGLLRLRGLERRCVLRLIEPEVTPAGQSDRGLEAEALFADGPGEVDSLAFQFCDGGVYVITHEVQLVLAALFGRMGRQLRRWQREDQPAATGIDGGELHDVSEEGAIPLRVGGEDDCVHSCDHVRSLPALAVESSLSHKRRQTRAM